MTTFLDQQIIDPPDGEWVTRLQVGNWVWLDKQGEFARVVTPFWEDPGCFAGTLIIDIYGADRHYKGMARWFVQKDGRGFDGSTLLRPIAGNVPTEGPRHPLYSDLLRKFEELERRVIALEGELTIRKAQDITIQRKLLEIENQKSDHGLGFFLGEHA